MAKSIQEFLASLRRNGVSLVSQYELSVSGRKIPLLFPRNKLTFYASSFDLPGFNYQFGTQIFWRGQTIEVPVAWDQDRDFSITVLDDSEGNNYNAFVDLFKAQDDMFERGYQMWPADDLTFRIKRIATDGIMMSKVYLLRHCKLKTVSGLTFSNTDASIMQFSIQGTAAVQEYEQQPI